MRSQILGTGHYLPPKVVTNEDLTKIMETSDEFIVRRTGIRRRRWAEADVSATDLAVKACHAAVADAGIEMGDVELLIMNTITPDHADPGCAFFLQPKLDLPGIAVMDIKEQCAGLIYGLSIADHYVRAGTYRHVLVVCSEVLSKRVDGSYDGRNIGILLGDGAGAVVVGPCDDEEKPGIQSTILRAGGESAKVLYSSAPGSAQGKMAFVDHDDIDAGNVHFRMDGRRMFEGGVLRMCESIVESLEVNNIAFDDLGLLIPHQPNLRMIEAIIDQSGIPIEKVYINVEEYGNMASACLPIALDQVRRSGTIKPGGLVMLVAFGSGFVWGSALLRL